MFKAWFLENGSMPHLLGEYKKRELADLQLNICLKRMANPMFGQWWLWVEENEN